MALFKYHKLLLLCNSEPINTLCSIPGMKYTNMENHEADGSTALGES